MTDTKGLPSEPIVDANGNLTSSWQHALAEIETLSSLKEAFDRLNAEDLGAMLEGLAAQQEALAVLLAAPIPNMILLSKVPGMLFEQYTDKVPHNVGSTLFLPYIFFVFLGQLQGGMLSSGSTPNTIEKTDKYWNYSSSGGPINGGDPIDGVTIGVVRADGEIAS